MLCARLTQRRRCGGAAEGEGDHLSRREAAGQAGSLRVEDHSGGETTCSDPYPIYSAPSPCNALYQVGVCASRGDALTVLEYSELDPAVASAPDPGSADGALMYNWGNICMHYFSTRWLDKVWGAWGGAQKQ